MIKKRGQIAVYVIVGIILVLVLSLIFYMVYSKKTGKEDLTKDLSLEANVESVKFLIDACNDQVALEGAYYLASHGGHYPLPNSYEGFSGYDVVYVYQHSLSQPNIVLSLDKIENNYENYIKDNLPLCVNHFEFFKNKGMDITEGDINVDVNINNNLVVVETAYDVTIDYKGVTNKILDLFTAEIPVRLGLMYDYSKKITEWIVEEPNFISTDDINYLLENTEGGMSITIDMGSDLTVYVLKDIDSSISPTNEQFEYVFGAKLD